MSALAVPVTTLVQDACRWNVDSAMEKERITLHETQPLWNRRIVTYLVHGILKRFDT
jgi:hypothetical protein